MGEAGDHPIRGRVVKEASLRAFERGDAGPHGVDQVDRSGRRVKEKVAADPDRAVLDGRPALRPGIRTDRTAGFGRLIDDAGTCSLRAGVHSAFSVRIESSPQPAVAVGTWHDRGRRRGRQIAELLNTAVAMERLQGATALDDEDARA